MTVALQFVQSFGFHTPPGLPKSVSRSSCGDMLFSSGSRSRSSGRTTVCVAAQGSQHRVEDAIGLSSEFARYYVASVRLLECQAKQLFTETVRHSVRERVVIDSLPSRR